MVNNPNSVPPPGNPNPNSTGASDLKKSEAAPKHTGTYQFTTEHKFLGMTFSAQDWNKLMNIMMRNMNDYINKTFQKMTEKMKKDWKRGAGEDPDD